MNSEEDLRCFLINYKLMRDTQRAYFGARKAKSDKAGGILIRSKELEKELDSEADRLLL